MAPSEQDAGQLKQSSSNPAHLHFLSHVSTGTSHQIWSNHASYIAYNRTWQQAETVEQDWTGRKHGIHRGHLHLEL